MNDSAVVEKCASFVICNFEHMRDGSFRMKVSGGESVRTVITFIIDIWEH